MASCWQAPDLVSSPVGAAHTPGGLSDALIRAIDANHWAHKPSRVGQIAFLGSRTPFQQDLRRIGTPSIVVATLDRSTVHRVSPNLLTVAWKAVNEPDNVDCEIVVKGAV